MGQYKVPQNVETEDKLVGPFSLRQLIYLAIAIGWAFIIYRIFKSQWVIMVFLILPVSGFFGVLGVAQREEQSFESYLSAVIRYNLVPRRRMWNKELSPDINTGAIQDPSLNEKEEELNDVPTKGELQQLAHVLDTHKPTNVVDSPQNSTKDSNRIDNLAKRIVR